MSFFIAIILGIIQGFTEFLPVSSSGHLVILENLFGVNFDFNFLNVLLHCSTLIAVVYFYRKTIYYQITHPLCAMNKYLLVATIPAIVFVICFGSIFDTFFTSPLFVGIGFLLTALFLSVSQIIAKKYTLPNMLNYKNVSIMGIAQAFAVFPGLSRSGTTLAFGLIAGTERHSALDFSFLMSIPIIIASIVYELLFTDCLKQSVGFDWWSILLSCVLALITALLGLKFMQKLIRKINFWYFVPYLIVLGLLVILFL